jgi:hypothetical protein
MIASVTRDDSSRQSAFKPDRSVRCSVFHPTDAAFKPSLYQCQSPPSGNAILRGRDKPPKPSLQFNLQIAETKCVHKSPPVRGDSH